MGEKAKTPMGFINEHNELVSSDVFVKHSLGSLSDIVKLLKGIEAKEKGVDLQEFARAGHIPPMAVVQELRRRGYRIETFDEDERCRLLAVPAAEARKRKRDQTQLFDPGPRSKPSPPQNSPYGGCFND